MAKAMGVAVGDGRRPAPRIPSSVPPNRPSPSRNPRRTAPPADTQGARQNVTAAADLFRIFIFPSKRDVRIDYRRCFVLRSLLCAKKKKNRGLRVYLGTYSGVRFISCKPVRPRGVDDTRYTIRQYRMRLYIVSAGIRLSFIVCIIRR